MATNATDGYHSRPASEERSLVLEGATTVAVSSRDGSLHATFCIQDPTPYPANDFAPTCRQLLRHLVGLLRLTAALCITILKLVFGLCHSSTKRVLGQFDSILDKVPHRDQLHRARLKPQIHGGWLGLEGLIGRTIVLPVQLTQAILDFDGRAWDPVDAHPTQEGDIFWEGRFENIVTIRLERHPPPGTAQDEYTHNGLGKSQRAASIALDDIPTLEGRSAPTAMYSRLLKRSLSRNHSQHISDRPSSRVSFTEDEPQHKGSAEDQGLSDDDDAELFNRGESSASMQDNPDRSSVVSLQLNQQFSKGAMSPMHNSNEASLYLPQDDDESYAVDAASAGAETSPLSSDLANVESFSPVQLPLPPTNSTGSLTSVRRPSIHSIHSSKRRHGTEQLSVMPTLAAHPSPPHSDHSPTTPESQFSGIAQETSRSITKWARKSRGSTSDIQTTCNDSVYTNEYPESCRSGRTSSYGEPSPPTSRISPQHRSEADGCDKPCISCETCDRRHERARQSKIPRRVNAVEHHRRRSSGPASCHSAQSTGWAAGMAGKEKFQKRKIKVY